MPQAQIPLSIEMLPTSNVTMQIPAVAEGTSQADFKEVSIPQPPYSPTNKQIQTALKNAGYYSGAIDGKLGPMSKKAIEEFQKANNLKVDGKVGPKTWAILEKYLDSSPVSTPGAQ